MPNLSLKIQESDEKTHSLKAGTCKTLAMITILNVL